jgi:hypothetical protein
MKACISVPGTKLKMLHLRPMRSRDAIRQAPAWRHNEPALQCRELRLYSCRMSGIFANA